MRGWDGEGSGQVDALAFSAGEIAGKAVGERGELKELEGRVGGGRMRLVADVGREGDVLVDGEVAEEYRALRSVGEIAKMSGDAAPERLQCFPTARNAAGELNRGVGNKTASGAEDGAFAAAGWAEEDGPRRRQLHAGGDLQGA